MPAVNITAQQQLILQFTRIYQNKIFNRFFFRIHFCYFYFSKVEVPGLLGMRGQMGPVTPDDRFETLAFRVCNSDGVEGLSWAEVEQCQVRDHSYITSSHFWNFWTPLPPTSACF